MRHRRPHLIASVLLPLAALAVASASGASLGNSARPVVQIVEAPDAQTADPIAQFRFTTRATRAWCKRDNQLYRRCRTRVQFTGMRPGRHVFRVRVRHNGRTLYATHRWTVRKVGPVPPSPPAAVGHASAIDPRTGLLGTGDRALVFADEFAGTTLDETQWRLYDGPGHAKIGLRRPSALSLNGRGHLVITAKMVDGKIVTGGMANRLDFRYGRVEFRVRTQPDPTGTMSGVVLTWPKHQLAPEFTENDIYETGPRVRNQRAFDSFIHFGASNLQKLYRHDVDPSQWHRVAMEWYPGLLEIYIDGLLSWSLSDSPTIPDVLHHVTLQLDPRAARKLKGTVRMEVDYVRIYR